MDLNELIVQEIIDSQQEKLDSSFKERLKKELLKQKLEIKTSNDAKTNELITELNKKNFALNNLTQIEIENERLKRDFILVEKRSQLELEKTKTELESKISTILERSISAKYELQLAEKEKQIQQVKKSARDAVQKASQGSMQLQGEVQEEAIESWLLSSFPLDKIHEVKKGAMGADCLQVVNEFGMQNCGTIYYESKNTKEFNNKWISKFKRDLQSRNADIGVLVTKTYPKNQTRMRVVDGVYICSFSEFKGLCGVLRNTIVEFSKHKIINENIIDKKELLYSFLTSKNFISGIERIIESFIEMNQDLEKEERNSIKNFSKRRVLMKIAQDQTVKLFTNFSGIAGSSIKNLELLEFDSDPTISNIELLHKYADNDENF